MDLFRKSAGYRYLDAFILANVIESIGAEFKEQGGFRERLGAVRSAARANQEGVSEEGPACPQCGAPMRQRRARKDNRPFWGCTQYPACRGVKAYEKASTAVDSNRQPSTAIEKGNP